MSQLIRFKIKKNSRYVVMELAALETREMSWKAKGLHAYLLSRPPKWEVHFDDLLSRSTEGRFAVRSALKELEAHGYLVREVIRIAGGTFSMSYTVYEVPESTVDGSTGDRKPTSGDQGRLPVGGSTVGGKPASLVVNTEKVTPSSKHLGKAGTSVPGGASAPDDLDPHSSHIKQQAVKKQTTLEEACEMPEAYLPVIDAWGKVATAHAPVTKIMANAKINIRKARTGTLFKGKTEFLKECRKYSVVQIVNAIERFGQMRNNPDYLPTEKAWLKEISLDKFFWNKFSNGKKSMFATCIRNGLMLASDAQPELTEWVAEKYNNAKGGKIDPGTITRIAAKLHRYWEENERHLKRIGLRNEKTMVTKWLAFLDVEIPDWGPQHWLAPDIHVQFEKYVRR